jgi:hypothetical protein
MNNELGNSSEPQVTSADPFDDMGRIRRNCQKWDRWTMLVIVQTIEDIVAERAQAEHIALNGMLCYSYSLT